MSAIGRSGQDRRTSRARSTPLIPGMRMSLRTRLRPEPSALRRASASRADAAPRTAYPSASSMRARISRTASSSSTTRMAPERAAGGPVSDIGIGTPAKRGSRWRLVPDPKVAMLRPRARLGADDGRGRGRGWGAGGGRSVGLGARRQAPAHLLEQALRGKRFGQHRAGRGDPPGRELGGGVAGDEDDRNAPLLRREDFHELDPVQAGHHDVRDDEVEPVAVPYEVEGLLAIGGLGYGVAAIVLEDAAHE